MTPTVISFSIVMVVVCIASIVWLQHYRVAGSTRRTNGMMMRLGLGFGCARPDNPRTKAIMHEAQRRCMRCPHEGYCDRWLAREVEGDNSFCPNAHLFSNSTGRRKCKGRRT